MTLIKHKKGGVKTPEFDLYFPHGKAVEVSDENAAKKILRNHDFEVVDGGEKRKGGKKK
jgi:hypothetical protein